MSRNEFGLESFFSSLNSINNIKDSEKDEKSSKTRKMDKDDKSRKSDRSRKSDTNRKSDNNRNNNNPFKSAYESTPTLADIFKQIDDNLPHVLNYFKNVCGKFVS